MLQAMQSPVLQYDNTLNLDGLSVTRGEGFVRVVTPRQRGWRSFGGWTIFGLLYFGLPLFIVTVRIAKHPAELTDSLTGILIHFVLLTVVLVVGLRRLHERVVFEITYVDFTVFRLSPARRSKTWRYGRDAVTDVHVNPGDPRKLSIRITGQELIELYISQDADVVARAAEAINEALRESVPAPATPTAMSASPPPMRRPWLLVPILLAIAIAAGTTATAMGSIVAGVLLFGMLAAPVGICYGVQKKEFWT